MKSAISDSERTISEIIVQTEISKEDANIVCYLLGSILTELFSNQNRESGLRSWCVDEMYADKIEIFSKKLSLSGVIQWLGGGGDCAHYQVDIALDVVPLLYSYKLKNKRWKQVMYIGKTFDGWVINSH